MVYSMIYTYDIYIDGIYRLWYIHIYMIWCMYYMVYIKYGIYRIHARYCIHRIY